MQGATCTPFYNCKCQEAGDQPAEVRHKVLLPGVTDAQGSTGQPELPYLGQESD